MNKTMIRLFFITLCLLLTGLGNFARAGEFLDPDIAFQQKSRITEMQAVRLDWVIASGYNLYKDKLHVMVGEVDVSSKLTLPAAIQKFDKNFNKIVDIYRNKLSVTIPNELIGQSSVLKLQYQGCSDDGLCYSPIDKNFQLANGKITPLAEVVANAASSPSVVSSAPIDTLNAAKTKIDLPIDEVSLAQSTLQSGSLWGIALSFLGFGLLLAFTPCVLPMVPILSSIIVGSPDESKPKKGFLLAVAYSLGMVMVYTSLGIAAGLAGEGLAAALQKPSVLIFFASMLFLLSLSMFDVYQLQLPGFIQNRLSNSSMSMQGGRFVSVFIMGALSALIVGPCVAGPLAGALIYISQSRDIFLGGLALFSMAIGMSVPLLLTGASAGAILPKAGSWMNAVKHFFGLMLLATSIWMLQSVLPASTWIALCGVWLILCAVFLKVFDTIENNATVYSRFTKAFGVIFIVFGIIELLGAGLGAKDIFHPFEPITNGRGEQISSNSSSKLQEKKLKFERIHTLTELKNKLQNTNKYVILDFYADWCTSCIEMDRFTFSDQKVIAMLNHALLLQIDVTKNSKEDIEVMKAFKVFGPPALLVFDVKGNEISTARVIGYLSPEKFTAHLQNNSI